MPRPGDVGVGVGVFIVDDEQRILLLCRKGAHQAGSWCPPGGWIDRSDVTPERTAIREVNEETGLCIGRPTFLMPTMEDHEEAGFSAVTLWYHIEHPGGVPSIQEPDKASDIGWFHLGGNLPIPLFPNVHLAAQRLRRLKMRGMLI